MSRITTRRKLSYEEPSSSSCSLCHGHHVHFSTPATWKSKEAQSYVLSLKITENDLICAACRKDIARVLNDSAYVPRWIEKSSVTTCCIVSCLETVFASLNQASGEQLHNIFETLGLETEANLSNPTPLCKKHYHLVYNILKSTQRDIIVQVSPIASSQLKLLHLKALVHALQNDPDLAHIDQKICLRYSRHYI